MIPDDPQRPWEQDGARAAVRAEEPGMFVAQHVAPLFFNQTQARPKPRRDTKIVSEAHFLEKSEEGFFAVVRLIAFKITDWFPRAPGVYWSENARMARNLVFAS